MNNWYSINNKHNNILDISIHDEIGLWGVNAADFIAELNTHKTVSTINLSIHSPGGNVLDGLAMYNALKSHRATVNGRVEGIAASAASFILMASDYITMPEDSFIMIHNAHGGATGEADELRSFADVMDKLQDTIVNIYSNRTSKPKRDIRQMMADETWMNATDALEHGFIDSIVGAVAIAAKSNMFNNYFSSMPLDVGSDDSEVNQALINLNNKLKTVGY